MKKKVLSLLVTFAMLFSVLPATALAAGETVAKIGETTYETFSDAMTAANAMTGNVVVDIYGAVEFINGMELKGSYDSITFNKGADGASITINQTAGGDYLEAHGKTVAFNDLTLAKANPAWANNSGHMGNYFSIQGGTVTYNRCVFPDGACTSNGTATYYDCNLNNENGEYSLWVYSQATVTVDSCDILGTKGIKMYCEGGANPANYPGTVTIKNTTFSNNITAKAAVAATYGEKLVLDGNTYNNSTPHIELNTTTDSGSNGIIIEAKDGAGNDITSTLTCTPNGTPTTESSLGVLVTDSEGVTRIYTTVAEAVNDAESGDTITLLHDSDEDVDLPAGVQLDKNNHNADNVTETVPVAYIDANANGMQDNGEQSYTSLNAAFSDATSGQTIMLLDDATPSLTSQRAITEASVIDLGGNTLTLKEDDLYFGTTTFKNGTIVVDPSVVASTAVFWMFQGQTLIFDNIEIIATGVSGTYLIGTNGGTGANITLQNGSKITIDNDTAANLTAVIAGNATDDVITIDNSTINVSNIIGRVALGGSYTVKGTSVINAEGVKEGFFIRANQSLSIEDTSEVTVTLNPDPEGKSRYGINLADPSAIYTKADTATVNANNNREIAKIGNETYPSVEAALSAAKDGETVELISGNSIISMVGSVVGGKTVTITGTAVVDWTQGNLFIGRGGEGNGTVVFDGANITSSVKKNPASYGIHVSGGKSSDANTNYGTLEIKNSNIELDYLINRNETVVGGNSTLTVYGGCYTHGRDASESTSGSDETATLTIEAGSTVNVINENGMGVGGEGKGIMTVNGTYNANVLSVSSKGAVNIGGAVKIDGAVNNSGSIKLTETGATLTSGSEAQNVTSGVADYKVVYANGVHKLVAEYVAKIGNVGYNTFEAALNAVADGETITLLDAEGSENKEIEFDKTISFTITGKAPNYALPVVIFQNTTVNIKDAEILIPELDARQNATINVIDSKVYDAGGDSIVKSYYNGAINIRGTSEVYTMQVTTMGYITISDAAKLHATWQTNVYGNGLITVEDNAVFNTAALQLTGKDYSGRDNTDVDRVGKPATIVVDGATFNVGKVLSSNGADYSYNSSKGINVGTVSGKKAELNVVNGGKVNIYMANGETANIGADGTVNNGGTITVSCRTDGGTVTLVNSGSIVLTQAEASLTANGVLNVTSGVEGYEAVEDSGTWTIQPKVYTITFDPNGGSDVSSVTYAFGATIGELPIPTRSGYRFDGWGTVPATMPAENLTLTAQWTRISSSGGGGGGGGSTSYTITVEDTKNGDITVSPSRASSGSTVTITVDPNKGYVLETLTVLDKNGKEVDLTKKADNKYTFKMPSGKVTVEATFMEDNTMLNYFTDVFASDYYYDAVLWAVENGITNGTSATTFSPSNPCTRAQMATFLWRAAGSPEPVGSNNPFVDVPADAYYAKAVQWAYEQGITGGTSATTFSPDQTCTRGQMATFLWRDAGSSAVSGEGAPFVDIPDDVYYATAVDWAYEEGITGGTSATTYSPNDPCTRGQMVTFLYRYLAD